MAGINNKVLSFVSQCGKVNISKTGRPMKDRIKDHDRDIRLAHTQTSTVSEHAHNTGHHPLWDEVKFIDRDLHWYTRRVKEAIHTRLHANNINRDSGIEMKHGCPQSRNTTSCEQEGC